MSNCCEKKKYRSPEEKKALLNRLSRIEGQLRGIRGMLEEDAYCIEILTQLSAAKAAVGALSDQLLTAHIKTCVVEGVRQGDPAVIDELTETVKKFMK